MLMMFIPPSMVSIELLPIYHAGFEGLDEVRAYVVNDFHEYEEFLMHLNVN
jgi:hypothetical protein